MNSSMFEFSRNTRTLNKSETTVDASAHKTNKTKASRSETKIENQSNKDKKPHKSKSHSTTRHGKHKEQTKETKNFHRKTYSNDKKIKNQEKCQCSHKKCMCNKRSSHSRSKSRHSSRRKKSSKSRDKSRHRKRSKHHSGSKSRHKSKHKKSSKHHRSKSRSKSKRKNILFDFNQKHYTNQDQKHHVNIKETKKANKWKLKKRKQLYIPRSEYNLLEAKGVNLIDTLGKGTYSKVYLCNKRDKEIENSPKDFKIALKIIDSNKCPEDFANKFLPREISVLLTIKHPHIIKMYLLFEKRMKYFLCMRYAERGDLLNYILSNRMLTENRARFWTYQLATAVEYLHTMNIVHRDIKLENVLITENFNVKLCDFGFSRFIDNRELTSTFCGSISYSSPEILQMIPYDAKKSDIWSLGIVIFVMLIKRLPFHDTQNPKLLLKEQFKKAYFVPPTWDQVISMNAEKVIKHVLEPLPKKRWGIKNLLNSAWIMMDYRLKSRTPSEIEAFEQAKQVAYQQMLAKIKEEEELLQLQMLNEEHLGETNSSYREMMNDSSSMEGYNNRNQYQDTISTPATQISDDQYSNKDVSNYNQSQQTISTRTATQISDDKQSTTV